MTFTATPTDGSVPAIPMSSAVPDGTNTPLALEGGPAKATGGNSLVPAAVYLYDGYDVAQGVTTDAAVVGDNAGTISAKLRGMTKILNDIWDSTNHLTALNIKQIGGVATQMATADNVTAGNLPEVSIGLFDNPGMFRWLSVDGLNADGFSGTGVGSVGTYLLNGTTWDRQRNNLDNITLINASGVTTTQTGSDQTNYNGHGVIVTFQMITVGTGSVTLEIDMKDPVSGQYIALLTGAAVVSNVTNIYTVYPGAPATANISANAPLPRSWRVKATANNANSTTYKVAASVIL